MRWRSIATPLGDVVVAGRDETLAHVLLPRDGAASAVPEGWRRTADELSRARAELREYFAGERRRFDLALEPEGTPFQLEVWDALREIAYGSTESYGDLARRIGRPRAVRAVGAANGANPLPIVLPCHRVVGADRSLTGYGGGLEAKRWLLRHEGLVVDGAGRVGTPQSALW